MAAMEVQSQLSLDMTGLKACTFVVPTVECAPLLICSRPNGGQNAAGVQLEKQADPGLAAIG